MVTEDRRAYNHAYYMRNREVIAERSRARYSAKGHEILAQRKSKYYSEDALPKLILARARQRAKTSGIEFDLTVADIDIPTVCPVLGMPIARNIGEGKAAPGSPSLDRVYPSQGYVSGNVQVISYKANCMKNNATPEELLAFANWVQRTFQAETSPADEIR